MVVCGGRGWAGGACARPRGARGPRAWLGGIAASRRPAPPRIARAWSAWRWSPRRISCSSGVAPEASPAAAPVLHAALRPLLTRRWQVDVDDLVSRRAVAATAAGHLVKPLL